RRTPVPEAEIEVAETAPDPSEDVELADTVGIALQLVLDRLSPNERVAFVMHDSFGFEFTTIAAALGTRPQAARKLASRARAKVTPPRPEDALADWEVVDAFMTAAREGDFTRLLELLAPDAVVRADVQAIETGTPAAIDGRQDVASFFNGAAHAALPVGIDGPPAPPGTTAARRGSCSTSPWWTGSSPGSTSAPTRRCWRGWCAARAPGRSEGCGL